MMEDTKMILEVIQGLSDNINSRFDRVEARLNSLENEMKEVKSELKEVKTLATQTAVSLENEIKPNIKVISGQYSNILEKVAGYDAEVSKQNARYAELEMTVNAHTAEIKNLKIAN